MSVRPRPRVLTPGETMGLVRAGETGPLRAGVSAHITIGGAETNVAIGLSRLGIGALWLGRVGDDAIGEAVLAALRAEGVELAAEVDAERPTGLMVEESRGSGRLSRQLLPVRKRGERDVPGTPEAGAVRERRAAAPDRHHPGTVQDERGSRP
ncbi:PfkB family carbohydrate kinase [Streptomyces sp. NPDC004042]|uniref:PfkB family carbohydrate kinase n=1 Tax=Streptomyces sp. NPDC004042 TaxID=3154451 RepID=UPI0033A7025C